jgi:predicted dehydrogenase
MVKTWQQLSVLIAGCGSIGKRHARVLESLGVSDIRACDPSPSQRTALLSDVPSATMYESFESGLRDHPDTVLICTPTAQHVPMASEAICAGCHVLCEKPLSDTTQGIDDLIKLASNRKKKVMVAYCFRYHEGLLRAKRYLDSNRVGRLVSMRALVGEHFPDVRPDYRDLDCAKEGGALELMHEVDLAVWYAGRPVRKVLALKRNYSDIGIEAPDVVEILMDFEGRSMASVHLDFFQRPRRRLTELICTEGVIIVELARWDQCTVSVYESPKGVWEEETLVTSRDDMFRVEDKEFLQAVAEGGPIHCSVEEARKSLEVILAAQS